MYVCCYTVPMMRQDDFYAVVRMHIAAHPEWRYGQVLFNSLMDIRPEWAEEIRGTDKDPFYANFDTDPTTGTRLGRFYDWLESRTF